MLVDFADRNQVIDEQPGDPKRHTASHNNNEQSVQVPLFYTRAFESNNSLFECFQGLYRRCWICILTHKPHLRERKQLLEVVSEFGMYAIWKKLMQRGGYHFDLVAQTAH